MARLELIRRMQPDEDIATYSQGLASMLFEGVKRDTGLPYTQEHLAKVADMTNTVLRPSRYKLPAIAAGWLHDAAEDITGLDVINPFERRAREPETVYLNDLLTQAGEWGDAACYIVDRMTQRKGARYQDYVGKIFDFPAEPRMRRLAILAAVTKVIDIYLNTNPDETKNVQSVLQSYDDIDETNVESLIAFHKKTRTIDAFNRKGSLAKDPRLLEATLLSNFRDKQVAKSFDNLFFNIPLAEDALLVPSEQGDLFDHAAVRSIMKDICRASLRLSGVNIYQVKRTGLNKNAPTVPGYTRIFKELRQESITPDNALPKPA